MPGQTSSTGPIISYVPDPTWPEQFQREAARLTFVLGQRALFKGPDVNINLHVFRSGCPEIGRMLRFRDWLRTHDDDRRRYEETKQQLAAQKWAYVQNYADAKSAIVDEILARADLAST